MPRPAGSSIGRYQILGFIARGETTIVYQALEPESGRKLALKILPPSVTRDPEAVKRFLRQADLLAGLDHENVLPVVDYGREGDVPFVASPVAGGGSLQDNMATYHSPEAALSLAATLAGALDYLHRRGVIHGRLGPGNILFDAQEKPMLTGFGQPYVLGDRGATPAYPAPEQRQGETADQRTDIYQLGALLFELLSGGPPGPDQDIQADARFAALPDDVQVILSQALAEAPEERFQTAGEMADLLTLSAQNNAAAVMSTETPTSEPQVIAPETARPEHARGILSLPGRDRNPIWLVAAATGLGILLTLCCLLAIFATVTISGRLRQPRATAQVDTNVRSGPTIEYEIVGILPEGQEAPVHGVSPDGRWWQIAFDGAPGGRGWVPAAFVTVDDTGNVDVVQPPTLTPFPTGLLMILPP